MIGLVDVVNVETPPSPVSGDHFIQKFGLGCVAENVLGSADFPFPVLGPKMLVSTDHRTDPSSPEMKIIISFCGSSCKIIFFKDKLP